MGGPSAAVCRKQLRTGGLFVPLPPVRAA